ncbi:uncharacterized protein LOC134238291 [Saccostrea cucullata]|uniref:uncharacterized protein LOC134238291 n=1 Tax=Saccostrea cuccullata TaxID=36930 RepID=UPI002ED0D70E
MAVSEKAIKDLEEEIPLSIKPVPKTMQIHQIIVPNQGRLLYRQLSCFCARPNFCHCFQPESACFPLQSTVDVCSSSSPEEEHVPICETSRINRISEVDESLVSKYCVVKYDGRAYPGVILAVDEDDELEVKTMHRVGHNRFFWPMLEDTLWYAKENVITLLKNPPRPVTKRHVEVDPAIWELIQKEEDEI